MGAVLWTPVWNELDKDPLTHFTWANKKPDDGYDFQLPKVSVGFEPVSRSERPTLPLPIPRNN